MLFPETVIEPGCKLEPEAELKQPDVGLCSATRKASELADSEVGIGSMIVEFGSVRTELLPPLLAPPTGDLVCQCLVTLDFELKIRPGLESWTELEPPSLSVLMADTEVRLELRSFPLSSDHKVKFGITVEFEAVLLPHTELGQRQTV